MSQEKPIFYLGLTMAGAVSAGCYTAGVLDYLFEILDLWERAKKGEIKGLDADLIPQYTVMIDAMGGTSAGGMTTMMAALYALEGKVSPVKEIPSDRLASQNILYDSWVHLVDAPGNGQKSFERLWDTEDLKGKDPKVRSLFNSSFVDEIANKAFDLKEGTNLKTQVKKLPSYISKDLELLISHTLIRGIPLEVQLPTNVGKGRPDSPKHTSYEHWLLSHFQLNSGKSVSQKDGFLWLNPYEQEHKKRLMLSTISTGAFPIGLEFRDFQQSQFTNDYYEKIVSKVVNNEFGNGSADPQELNFSLSKDFESLTIDGGAMNNEPYREVASILRRHRTDGPFQNYGLVMIDPFPDVYEAEKDQYLENKPKDLLDLIPMIITTLWDQSKIKRKEVLEQFSRDYIISQIFPKRNLGEDNDITATSNYPIASGSLAAFGGLLDIEFRTHDFFLGRNNARNFVRYFFSLPYYKNEPSKNHPIHRNWTKASINKYKFYKRDPDTNEKQYYLPIIPDLNIVLNNLSTSGEEWNHYDYPEKPTYNPQALFKLRRKIKRRYKKMLYLIIGKFSKSVKVKKSTPLTNEWIAKQHPKVFFKELMIAFLSPATLIGKSIITSRAFKWFISWILANILTKKTFSVILKDLEEKGLLDEPYRRK